MNSADLIKLARIFDKFIILKSSIVRIDDISAIKRCDKGIEVVTPYGKFKDDTDYDSFITRIKDTLEVLKQAPRADKPSPPPGRIIKEGGKPQSERKVVPLNEAKQSRRVSITVGPQGAEGVLFSDPNLEITDRESISILDPTGEIEVAKAGEGSAIQGEKVSGFIYTSGKYVLSFKEYPHKTALVSYTVQPKKKLDQ